MDNIGVMGEAKKYFVQVEMPDGEVCETIKTAAEIIAFMDMADCHDCQLSAWKSAGFGKLEPLTVHGTWHDLKRPLYIKAVDQEGNIEFDGWGTDH